MSDSRGDMWLLALRFSRQSGRGLAAHSARRPAWDQALTRVWIGTWGPAGQFPPNFAPAGIGIGSKAYLGGDHRRTHDFGVGDGGFSLPISTRAAAMIRRVTPSVLVVDDDPGFAPSLPT
jgi:hypothetical protein